MSKEDLPIRILITGAAGHVAYSLSMLIASGMAFGSKQPLIFHLLDIPTETGKMEGLVMELIDSAFPLLREVIATCDPVVAFQDISAAFLLGAKPRRPGVLRRELIEDNVRIFKDQGMCLEAYARKDCKVVVIAEPCNTMVYVCSENAPSIPRENFTANARLDHNRALAVIATKLKVPPAYVKNVIIWGNHTESMHPDCSVASVIINNKNHRVTEVLSDEIGNLKAKLAELVPTRGTAILSARKQSSGISAAKAICDQMRDWVMGTPTGTMISMTVSSDGSYGVPKEIFFSFPVEIQRGKWNIVRGIKLDEVARTKIDICGKELLQEKMTAIMELGDNKFV